MKKYIVLLCALVASFPVFAETPAGAFGGMEQILLLVVFIGIFYFLIIRPQSKRNKQQRQMISALAVGDEVVSAGGMYGRIAAMDDAIIDLEVAKGVQIKLQKTSIATVLPKKTIEETKTKKAPAKSEDNTKKAATKSKTKKTGDDS